ncbi:MAG: selenide, water dikinase SelD [Defluviitaleaceae bacterium]|nr:selenide, water dikinase SelD [Defluviitaleaceae bacterium]MCL2239509.1 selenide, water dikinase SelD [Defluviitaleaceae bacterium]
MLKSLPKHIDPALLVGYDTSDDACVYRLGPDLAMIQTLDFFPPIVDDPFAYGQIAAANALSDIYAMGAAPALALNILCVPGCLTAGEVAAILAGGAEKVREAGAIIAGGHSVEDAEPKYGLCVSAFADPVRVWSNAGAKPGDALILTKPLGNGILATAAKQDKITQAAFAPAIAAMATLNKYARDAAVPFTVHACTDITGFGFLGHACEMAVASQCSLMIHPAAMPIFDGVLALAQRGVVPGGAKRNADYLAGKILLAEEISPAMEGILHDPQTSGGLLLCVPQEEKDPLLAALEKAGAGGWAVGGVVPQGAYAIEVKDS